MCADDVAMLWEAIELINDAQARAQNR